MSEHKEIVSLDPELEALPADDDLFITVFPVRPKRIVVQTKAGRLRDMIHEARRTPKVELEHLASSLIHEIFAFDEEKVVEELRVGDPRGHDAWQAFSDDVALMYAYLHVLDGRHIPYHKDIATAMNSALKEMQEAGYDVTGGTAGAASSSSPGGKPVTA